MKKKTTKSAAKGKAQAKDLPSRKNVTGGKRQTDANQQSKSGPSLDGWQLNHNEKFLIAAKR